MQKRGIADFNFGHLDNDDNAIDWHAIVAASNAALETSPLGWGLGFASRTTPEGHTGALPFVVTDGFSEDAPGGPEAAAAGGKKTGGGTTSGSGSGTTGTGTGAGQGTTTTVLHDIPLHWQTLSPPTGDTGLPTDPWFANWQWSLTNPTTGIDVIKAWQNYTGLGVKIGIVDDGIDYNHPDLNPHYLFNLQYDAVTADGSAYGNPSTDFHGTTVAGILAAARDGSGIVGVAYNAGIAGDRISYATGGASQLADALNHLAMNGFDIDIVFAAGNGRAQGDNVNYHNFQNDPYVITVAATDINGHVTTFSTPGAALLVSAPGLGTITDDRLGSAGYSTGDFTSAAGTSYAAPTVAGVIALMLQANPNLGYRDVQEILAYSAKDTDPTNTSWQIDGAHDWNGGGLHFSPDYGFGLVDATAAVRLAESWQKQSTLADMSTESATHTDNATIPDGTGSLQSQITFASSLDIEKMVIDLNITHPHVSDLTVTLTSPDGTSAVLASHPASGTGSGIVFETSANNFWGEDAKGIWTLTVTDSVAGNVGQ